MAKASLSEPKAPIATQIPVKLEKFGDVRIDPYFWMKDRKNPKVIKYLKEENKYLEKKLAPTKPLQKKIFQEFRSRLKEDDSSFPYQDGDFFYYARFEKGKEYPIYARKKKSLKGKEEILMDVNKMARGHSYYSAAFPKPSPDHTKILFAVDTKGRRFYDLYVKDLKTGKLIGAPVKTTTGNAVWANDNQTIFYSKQHPETLRSQWIYRHKIGQKKSELIFEEKDELFNVGVGKSITDKFIFISSDATLSSEIRFLEANNPGGDFQIFHVREKDHEYSIQDGEDGFYIRTNWQARNFRLMKASATASKKEKWQEVVAHDKNIYLDNFEVFKTHLAIAERRNGLTQLRVIDRESGKSADISFPDPVYVVDLGSNAMYDTPFLRYNYESPVRPDSIFDYSFQDKKSQLRKEKEIPKLDTSKYTSERVWVSARDGTKVPVSLVYKKGFKKDGSAPLFQYGYGSYGYSMEPGFSSQIFSFLDRGFVYAIAHIRGGSEMGRYWYEEGKFLKKKNTFTDFIDVTEFLIQEKYCDPARIYAEGGSAGGLLMGAIMNMRPDLYKGVIAAVPFVDVLTTMLDDSIPLTTGEYDEWGNPNQKEYYDYMKSYSPYDNVEKKAYPNLLITSGLHDSQVQYWEPTKWAAKLRHLKTNDSLLLLKTEMKAGHGGVSGRFQRMQDDALEYAFILMLDGQNVTKKK